MNDTIKPVIVYRKICKKQVLFLVTKVVLISKIRSFRLFFGVPIDKSNIWYILQKNKTHNRYFTKTKKIKNKYVEYNVRVGLTVLIVLKVH